MIEPGLTAASCLRRSHHTLHQLLADAREDDGR
jgi:hypothetical protein